MSIRDDQERHGLASALYLRAMERTAGERVEFVRRESGSDTDLLTAVGRLLDQTVEDFLEIPALGGSFRIPELAAISEACDPQQIADYEILARLGAGGMGVVYRARDQVSGEEVALKLLRQGMLHPQSVARFEREVALLSSLDHPGIAGVQASGTADEGAGPQPWLAMELVEGSSLLEHVAQNALDIPARVSLLASICDAVDHAHQRGVVHRDLKPSNILVTTDGQPQVVDFGIARSLDEDLDATNLLTRPGELLGTLPYMSPEQASCDQQAVGSRSDVFALGAILYELLTGSRPHELQGLPLTEAVRVVTEVDPRSAAAIAPELRGDLDTILQTAMQREPSRRYARAADLAADLRRHLAGELIVATGPGVSDQLLRLVRRYRTLIRGGSVAAAVLVALAAGLTWGWMHALDAETEALHSKQQAEEESARARLVTDYLLHMMGRADPMRDGAEVTLLKVLQDMTEDISSTFAEDPMVLGDLHHGLGAVFHTLGDYERAEQQIRDAYAVKLAHLGPDHPETLEADSDIGVLLSATGRMAEAAEHLQQALVEHVRALGEGHEKTMRCRGDLVVAYTRLQQYALAEQEARRNLEMRTEFFGPDDPETVISLIHLANVAHNRSLDESALPLLEEASQRAEQVLEPHHPLLMDITDTLGHALLSGDPKRARELMERMLVRRMEVNPAGHPDTQRAQLNLAWTFLSRGEFEEAERRLRVLCEAMEKARPDHPDTLTALSHLGTSLRKLQRLDEAETILRKALRRALRVYPSDHYRLGVHKRNLGVLLGETDRHEKGEPLLLDAYGIITAFFPADHAQVRLQHEAMEHFYTSWGRPAEAARYAPGD